MHLHMSLQVSTLRETLLANQTVIRAFSSMPPHMDLQGTTPHERLLAIGTQEWSFSTVTPHMVGQMTCGGESASTVILHAFVGFGASVNAVVCFEVASFCESLVTVIVVAKKWLYSGL